MKNLSKYLFLLLISIVLLAGCNNPLASQKSSGANVQTTVEVVDSADVVDQEEVEEGIIIKDYSCDMLKSESRKKECKQMINEMIAESLLDEISRTYDAKRCDELDGYRVESCKSRIEKTGVKGPVGDDDLMAMREALNMICPEEEDVESECTYDVTKCSVLNAPGLKEYCEKQVNERSEEEKLWRIVESGDSSKCSELTVENIKINCEEEFGIYSEEELDNEEA